MRRGIIGIYCIKDTKSGKVYIGQSVDVEYRICNHFSKLKYNRHDNEHMQRAYNKNSEFFEWELLKECKEEELDKIEIETIAKYDSTNPKKGFNHSYGGQQTHRATEETRKKMSQTKKGKKFTKEHCQKIGEANRHRKLSEGTKRKISLKHSKPVIQLTKDGKIVNRYNSVKEAASEVRLKSPTSIRNVIIGLAPTAAGYVWKYE